MISQSVSSFVHVLTLISCCCCCITQLIKENCLSAPSLPHFSKRSDAATSSTASSIASTHPTQVSRFDRIQLQMQSSHSSSSSNDSCRRRLLIFMDEGPSMVVHPAPLCAAAVDRRRSASGSLLRRNPTDD